MFRYPDYADFISRTPIVSLEEAGVQMNEEISAWMIAFNKRIEYIS
jgi:hypothetical protein